MADPIKPRPDDSTGQQALWNSPAAFLKWTIALILVSCVVFLTVLFSVAPDQVRTPRGGGPVVLLLLAASAMVLLRRGRTTAAAYLLGASLWVYATGISILLGGLHSMFIIVYPLVIMLAGWMLGARAAIVLAALTVGVSFGFLQGELWGILAPPPPTPPALLWIVQSSVFIFSAILITYLVSSYRIRLAEVRKLGLDLAQSSAELHARETDLYRAQAVAHVGSWVYHLATDEMRLSAETCRIFGLPEGTTGNHDAYLSRVHPEDRNAVDLAWQEATRGGEPFDHEHRILIGKKVRWIRQIAELEFDADGKALRSVGTTQDITERKLAELKVLAAQSQLQATLEAIPDLLFEVGLDGRCYGAHSPRTDLLVAPAESVIGRKLCDVLPPDAAEVAMSALREAHETGRSHGRQYELQVPRGRLWFELSVSRKAVDSGMEPRFIALARDITERRHAEARHAQIEAQLRESQKMEALGTLAGGVAHDFNNIIAAIIGNAELARQDVGPSHPAMESLEEIRKASQRAKELVRQILAFGRRQVLERKVIALAPVVEESARLLRATLPAGVGLNVECAADAPAVLADATQIEQVLLNLCSNAWHAVQGQGRPGVIEVRLTARETPSGRYACLTVRDNGPGMDAATRKRIFEPFFTTKPVDEGTGLGLSVVHGIVQAHQASIEVESAPGAGSTFRVLFPAAAAPAAAASLRPAHASAPQEPGKRILYVDDDEAIVFLMQRMLARQGYQVSAYSDPREAIAAARSDPGRFDLAVTDYNMPGMSGLEVARALREIRADLPVALASGYITAELHARAPGAGVSELIHKPDTVEDFCDAVVRLASRQRETGHCA